MSENEIKYSKYTQSAMIEGVQIFNDFQSGNTQKLRWKDSYLIREGDFTQWQLMAHLIYQHYKIEYQDPQIISFAIDHLERLIISQNIDELSSYFDNPKLNLINYIYLNNAVRAVLNESDGIDLVLSAKKRKTKDTSIKISPRYQNWIDIQGQYIYNLLSITKEFDQEVLDWLNDSINYLDHFFIFELSLTQKGNEIITKIYDLRGIDFFLNWGTIFSSYDSTDEFIEQAEYFVHDALISQNRIEAVKLVRNELKTRKERLVDISNNFIALNENIGSEEKKAFKKVNENLIVLSEQFWIEYLSLDVYQKLSEESKKDLENAFASEYYLNAGARDDWDTVIYKFTKVIEREMVRTFFTPWVDIIQKSSFCKPSWTEIEKSKNLEYIYKNIFICSKNSKKNPSLGDLISFIGYWGDTEMNASMGIYKKIKEHFKNVPDYDSKIKKFHKCLTKNMEVNGKSATINKLRNSVSHPGYEHDYNFKIFVDELKNVIGKPPSQILRSLVIDLRLK